MPCTRPALGSSLTHLYPLPLPQGHLWLMEDTGSQGEWLLRNQPGPLLADSTRAGLGQAGPCGMKAGALPTSTCGRKRPERALGSSGGPGHRLSSGSWLADTAGPGVAREDTEYAFLCSIARQRLLHTAVPGTCPPPASQNRASSCLTTVAFTFSMWGGWSGAQARSHDCGAGCRKAHWAGLPWSRLPLPPTLQVP